MDSVWARTARSQANLPTCLVFYLLLSAAAEGRPDERRLTEVDKEYIAPGLPIANELRQKCHGIGQFEPLKGDWVKHPDHSYQGMTDPNKCPHFINDYDCRSSDMDAKYHSLQQKEFRKVFRPHGCDLHAMNASHFSQCLAGQRMIIIGDSTMRQVFQSLGCLLHEEVVDGYLVYFIPGCLAHKEVVGGYPVPWEEALANQTAVPFEKQYYIRDTEQPILKQNVGMFKLRSGAEVHFQSFGIFNLDLWDDVMKKFMPLTKKDIIFVEFGAWYPRFAVWDMHKPWDRYQKDMYVLLDKRLRSYSANVLWRAYGPTHFGGPSGTFTGMQVDMPDMPAQDQCEPAKYGEYYYDTEVIKYLKKCKDFCAHIHILPVYHLSLPAHNSHHGSFGRGISEGAIDCRHYCANVVDTWNQVLYNKLCFMPMGKKAKTRGS